MGYYYNRTELKSYLKIKSIPMLLAYDKISQKFNLVPLFSAVWYE